MGASPFVVHESYFAISWRQMKNITYGKAFGSSSAYMGHSRCTTDEN